MAFAGMSTLGWVFRELGEYRRFLLGASSHGGAEDPVADEGENT